MTEEQPEPTGSEPPELPDLLNTYYIIEAETVLFGQRLNLRQAVPREQWEGMGSGFQESYIKNMIQRMGVEAATWLAAEGHLRMNVTAPARRDSSFDAFAQDQSAMSRPYRSGVKAQDARVRLEFVGGPLHGQERLSDGYLPRSINVLYKLSPLSDTHGTAVYARDENQNGAEQGAVRYRYIRDL